MTSPQLPDAEPQPGRLPESVASPEKLNPYVTMTTLPSAAPVSPANPNPYVTSTTVLPPPTLVPTAVLSASAVQPAAPTPEAATPQPPVSEPVSEPLSAPVSDPVPEPASSLSIPLPAQATVSAPAVPSPTVVAPPAPFPTTVQAAPPTMPPPLPPRANRARSRAATPKPAAKQGQAWVVVGVGIVLLIMFLGSLGRESTSDFMSDDPGEAVIIPDDGTADDEPPRSVDHLRDESEGPGSYAEPYAIDEEFTLRSWDESAWMLRVTEVVLDADDIVAASGRYNPEPDPGSQYVLVRMQFSFEGGGEEDGHPWYDFMTSISAPDGLTNEENAALDVPGRISDAVYLAVGETVEHALMYSVPTHLIDGSVLLVDAFGDHAYVALN